MYSHKQAAIIVSKLEHKTKMAMTLYVPTLYTTKKFVSYHLKILKKISLKHFLKTKSASQKPNKKFKNKQVEQIS